MNNWIYNNMEIIDISQFPKDTFGFIYQIHNTIDDRYYIGKKQLWSKRNKLLSKKDIKSHRESHPTGRLPKKKLIITESNWKQYYGSSLELNEDINFMPLESFTRTILDLSFSKRELTYLEAKHLFKNDVLDSCKYYNKNILNKFYK